VVLLVKDGGVLFKRGSPIFRNRKTLNPRQRLASMLDPELFSTELAESTEEAIWPRGGNLLGGVRLRREILRKGI